MKREGEATPTTRTAKVLMYDDGRLRNADGTVYLDSDGQEVWVEFVLT